MADIKCTILFAEDDRCRYKLLKNYLEVNEFKTIWHIDQDKTGIGIPEKNTDQFIIGKYVLDSHKRILHGPHGLFKLTSLENELLKLLCQNKNSLLLRDNALKKLWGSDSHYNARSMDVYISKIRKYLKDDQSIEIMNIHGRGFKLII